MDVAYSGEEGAATTLRVAERLEKEYGVMKVFTDLHMREIANDVTGTYKRLMEQAIKGKKLPRRPVHLAKIPSEFRDYLQRDEWQNETGRTIRAAQEGISHRFRNASGKTISPEAVVSGKETPAGKAPKRSRGPRPAFIDTGLYARSFNAFLDLQ